jgi:hypothetical protein
LPPSWSSPCEKRRRTWTRRALAVDVGSLERDPFLRPQAGADREHGNRGVKLVELGSVLVGRLPGAELRERIVEVARTGEVVVLDFADVVVVSPSFADELFARLDPSLVSSGAVKFENVDDDVNEIASFLRRARATS